MAPDPKPTWPLSAFQFPERWWDVHLVRTPFGDVLPIRTRYPDGTLATGPIVTGEFVLAEDLETRRQCVREIIVTNLQPRSFPDPEHAPPPALETPAVVVPPPPDPTPVETPTVTVPETKAEEKAERKDVKELLKDLESSVEAAKEAKKPK